MSCCRDLSGLGGSSPFVPPNTVVITSNSTYTSSPGVQYIEVYAIGGGGGGGGSNASRGGGGGGAACPSVGFYDPGVYAVTIGSAGTGGAADTDGSNGSDTNFGAGLLISDRGVGGGSSLDASIYGGESGTADATAMYSLARESGKPPAIAQGGCGGSCYFGTGGRSFLNTTTAVTGEDATGFGAGGGGGSSGGSGGNGSAGAVIIIEHF